MEHLDEHDYNRLKELLRRTGEFIAYFELVETKMMEWRQDIEQLATTQQQQFQQQLHAVQTELGFFHDVLTQAGLARFRITADSALNQGKEYLLSIQKTEQQLLKQMANHQRDVGTLTATAVSQIAQHAANALERIDTQLGQYDVQHFRRIASESCAQVEKSAQNVIVKSGRLLRLFQWRSVAMALLTTLAVGLYMSDEYPWEVHQHAMSEREAGKMLMSAWQNLSYHEKTKILGDKTHSKA